MLRCAIALSAFVFIAGGSANAIDKIPPAPVDWKVSKNFEGKDARTNLSGAACTTRAPPFASCLIVNDEEQYAQFFSITGTTIKPGKVIRLRDKDSEGDPDGEGAAYDGGFFYVTGSHGRARNSIEKSSVPSYVVFRIPVDEATGKPAKGSDKKVVGVEASTRLHDVIHDSPDIGKFFNVLLANNGANIEGIAVKDGRMYLGFRGPSTDSNAFILSVDAAKVFTKKDPVDPKVAKVKLGPNAGIRDLAAVEGGVLILSGPVNDQAVVPSIFFWNDQSGVLKTLGELEIPEKLKADKAETLLILRDEKDKPYHVLIMFDGPANGGPTEYHIPR